MRADWDHRARENVFYYIASSKDDWDPAEFYASGEQSVEGFIRPDMGEIWPAEDLVERTLRRQRYLPQPFPRQDEGSRNRMRRRTHDSGACRHLRRSARRGRQR